MGSGSSFAAPKYSVKATADMIAKEFGSNAKDLNIVITGANSGIGLESARVLSRSGAKVVLACRSKKNAEEAILKIKEENPSADVTFMELDLTSLESIHSFADQYKASNRPLNVLLNNKDGFEMQLGVNYLGPFYLTCQLWDVLKRSGSASAPSRILNVSSDSREFSSYTVSLSGKLKMPVEDSKKCNPNFNERSSTFVSSSQYDLIF